MLRRWRMSRCAEALGHHFARLEALERARAEYQAEDRKAMVLAVNYEIVSEAARALLELRKLEELGGDPDALPFKRRSSGGLADLSRLPALPHHAARTAAPQEVDRLYSSFLAIQGQPSQSDRREGSAPAAPIDRSPTILGSGDLNRQWRDYSQRTSGESMADEVDPLAICSRFDVSSEYFELKYKSYSLALKMSGREWNWNEDIDEVARRNNVISEWAIELARRNFHQAVVNRVVVALHMEREAK